MEGWERQEERRKKERKKEGKKERTKKGSSGAKCHENNYKG